MSPKHAAGSRTRKLRRATNGQAGDPDRCDHATHVVDPYPRLKHYRDCLQCRARGRWIEATNEEATNGGVRQMRYWLVKSEPDAFSWDQQVANGVEPWTGVRNHAAKLNLKAMKKGDLAFFYHSNVGKEIVGVVEVAREAYPDPTAEKGDWVSVDMKAVSPVPKPVSLTTIKEEPALEGIPLIRQSRLSVMEISPEHWKLLSRMGGWKR